MSQHAKLREARKAEPDLGASGVQEKEHDLWPGLQTGLL
jgi:hypothetical protein